MTTTPKTPQEKQAAALELMFNQVYVPAFVNLYNEKAAAANLTPISNQADLENAFNLTHFIEQNTAKTESNLLTKAAGALNKVASANAPKQDARASQFAKLASAQPELITGLKSLV